MAGNVPREMIDWFPRIDAKKCTGCGVCVEFCTHRVYSFNEKSNQAEVTSPYECLVGCSNCTGQCRVEAITFPTMEECKEMIDKARAEIGKNQREVKK